jgi:TPR repeat protein
MAYENGRGVAQEDAEAVNWYRLAAAQGLAKAQVNLGYLYSMGRGVVKDDTEAANWYRLAAAQGHAGAQANLGLMYGKGRGVGRDDVKALAWLILGATKGEPVASFNRDAVARRMSPQQITDAQQMAQECLARSYQGCD